MDTFAATMRRMRSDAHLSLRQLARAIPADPGHLSRVEGGTRRPTPELAVAIDTALDAGGRLAALAPRLVDTHAAAARQSERLCRLIAAPPGDRADQLLTAARTAAVDYLSTPPGPMLDRVAGLRRDAVQALRRTRRPGQLADVTLALGEMSGVLAYAALDLGKPGQAHAHAEASFTAADAAGSGELKAWVRGTQSLIARFAGDYPAALRFALDGLRYTSTGTARVRLLCGVAQCHANLGDAVAARSALDAAADARDDVSGVDGAGLFGFSEVKQAYYSGSSLIWLPDRGDAERALAEATRAIRAWSTGPAAERSYDDEALAHVYAATAAVQMRDVERAAALLEPILGLPEDRRISWIRKRMLRVAGLLAVAPYVGDPVAAELRERIGQYR